MVIPRRLPNLSVHSALPGVAIQSHIGPKDGSPLYVKHGLMESIRKTIPIVDEALHKTQRRHKWKKDTNLGSRNRVAKIGGYVDTKAHKKKNQLQIFKLGPFLEKDKADKTLS